MAWGESRLDAAKSTPSIRGGNGEDLGDMVFEETCVRICECLGSVPAVRFPDSDPRSIRQSMGVRQL